MEIRAEDLLGVGSAAVVAPAGHGKTELITRLVEYGRRTLVLTHTHAGVNAIRQRLKRHGIPESAAAVDTIAGWSMRYANAFPGIAEPPAGMPNGAEWDQLYVGARKAVAEISAVRQIVESSYDRILIDEYQDCSGLQHELAVALSGVVPTLVFGDPMQGIFEFAGADLSWEGTIHAAFPYAGTLETPHRWARTNPELGEWIADARERLASGLELDFESCASVTYRASVSAFDMGAFFDGMDGREGTFAAIHCRKDRCYALAKATRGGYQAIEEVAANRLRSFADLWDRGNEGDKAGAVRELLRDAFYKQAAGDGADVDPESDALLAAMEPVAARLESAEGPAAALEILRIARRIPAWKAYRGELLRDAERALESLAAERSETMADAVDKVRQRTGIVGRKLPKRTVSTPLLLKGLEFEHVLVPEARHFATERRAQAKLFYVAISRATSSLTITSPAPRLTFPVPAL